MMISAIDASHIDYYYYYFDTISLSFIDIIFSRRHYAFAMLRWPLFSLMPLRHY
jgi:hypothetical protein